jgi:hypothetical protein
MRKKRYKYMSLRDYQYTVKIKKADSIERIIMLRIAHMYPRETKIALKIFENEQRRKISKK